MSNDDEKARWHQVVMIWVRDMPGFEDYMAQVRPIVEAYGAAADASFTPLSIEGGDGSLELPDIVNLVHSVDHATHLAFHDDPDFKRVRRLRDESVDLLSVEGRLSRETPVPQSPERDYNIELVRFAGGSAEAYGRYEAEGESVMARYGFHVDYVLDIEDQPSARRRFDLAKISHFADPTGRAAFEADPMHGRIEDDLYPAAVSDVLWITAKLRPL